MTNQKLVEELRKRIEEIHVKHRVKAVREKPVAEASKPFRPLDMVYPRAAAKSIEGQGFTTYRSSYTAIALDWFSPVAHEAVSSLATLADGGKKRKPLPELEPLFLDIETTGLLGAGTVAFLVGLGRWQDSQFLITQFFLHDRELEEIMLEELVSEISSAGILVTFNGKGFDVPVMQTRFIMNGMAHAAHTIEHLPHLDLYSLVRRLGKHPLHKMNLQACVRRFLGMNRRDDISGSMIPALYYIYEKDRDPSVLETVFEHNRMDILDMVGLLGFMGRLFKKGRNFTKDAFALAGVGKSYMSLGRVETAKQFLQASIDCLHPSEIEAAAPIQRLFAALMRKEGNWDKAALIWRSLIDCGRARFEDYLWLSRYYEIHKGEIETSFSIVNQCIEFYLAAKRSLPKPVMSRQRRLQRLMDR